MVCAGHTSSSIFCVLMLVGLCFDAGHLLMISIKTQHNQYAMMVTSISYWIRCILRWTQPSKHNINLYYSYNQLQWILLVNSGISFWWLKLLILLYNTNTCQAAKYAFLIYMIQSMTPFVHPLFMWFANHEFTVGFWGSAHTAQCVKRFKLKA